MSPATLFMESLAAVAREARRTFPMAAGVAWGVASVFVLVAVGRGFEATQRDSLASLGDSFMLLRVNKGTATRGDSRASAFVRLDGEDIEAVRAGAPSIGLISPKANNWMISAFHEENIARVTAIGVEPQYADIVHIEVEPGGRWIDHNDLEQELPVCVLGFGTSEDLFGPGVDPVGREFQLVFTRREGEDSLLRTLTVIGKLADSELGGDELYTSHRTKILMPFTTWERMSPRDFQFFVLRPRDGEDREAALAEVREVLGARKGFDGTNRNTLVPYFDAYERKERLDEVFGGLELFLGAVGVLILALGAIGVANVVLMSVTARTFEFGLRRALGCRRRWIFAQVFLEAALVCAGSGLLGFMLGVSGVEVLSVIDLPEGFATPKAELEGAWLPGVLLLVVSVAAAVWPAARAARMSPAEALRGGHL